MTSTDVGRGWLVVLAAQRWLALACKEKSTASGMPQSALSAGVIRESLPLDELAQAITVYVEKLSGQLGND